MRKELIIPYMGEQFSCIVTFEIREERQDGRSPLTIRLLRKQRDGIAVPVALSWAMLEGSRNMYPGALSCDLGADDWHVLLAAKDNQGIVLLGSGRQPLTAWLRKGDHIEPIPLETLDLTTL